MTNSIFVDWTAPQKRDELPRLHSIPPRRSRGGAERPPVFSTYRIGLLHCIAMRPHQRWQLWVIFPRGPSVRYRSASAVAPGVEGEKVPGPDLSMPSMHVDRRP